MEHFLALKAANQGNFNTEATYPIGARFDNIGRLKVRAPVRRVGVTVGCVTAITLDNNTFRGVVGMGDRQGFQVPNDSSARILTAGLLGDQYAGREPGGAEANLACGATITQTQSALVLERPDSPSAAQQGGRRGQHQRGVEVKLSTGSRGRAALLLLALCTAGAVPAQPTSGVAPIMSVLDAPAGEELTAGQIADPWEPFNRAMFRFNQDLDQGLLLPWTDAYMTLVPELARIGIGNFFANAQDLWSSANNLMQGKFARSVMMTMRFATNTVLGAFGLIDIATAVGMERWPEDFGQTLGVWGVAPGPYLVLPVFGPSTARDAVGLPLDLAASPYYAINESAFRPVTAVLGALNARSQLLSATQALDAIALDKYSFVRDAFLSRRLRLVFDGNPPDDYELKPLVTPKE